MTTLPSPFSGEIQFYVQFYRVLNSMEYTYHYPAQEWQWSEDDVSIIVVNNATDNGISIYINERLVSKFIVDRGWSPKSLWEKELRIVEGVSVHTVLLEFIDKWNIGV